MAGKLELLHDVRRSCYCNTCAESVSTSLKFKTRIQQNSQLDLYLAYQQAVKTTFHHISRQTKKIMGCMLHIHMPRISKKNVQGRTQVRSMYLVLFYLCEICNIWPKLLKFDCIPLVKVYKVPNRPQTARGVSLWVSKPKP